MATLISCQNLSKAYGTRKLFSGISLGIEENERLGIIGPNGAGKSTLLQIFAGMETADSGTVSARRNLSVAYVPQSEVFKPGATVLTVLQDALKGMAIATDTDERDRHLGRVLESFGFVEDDWHKEAAALSGGWRKRLSLARAAVREPELLLLDEPTNHLDLEGVIWLESFLTQTPQTFAVACITHDRAFLENISTRVLELSPVYKEGYLSVQGGYGSFLERREEARAEQTNLQTALSSQVKREIEWLRRGAKARTTKAKGRIEDAHEKIADLAEVNQREKAGAFVASVSFTASGRQTKELIAAKGVSKSLGGRTLFEGLDVMLTPKSRLGLLGTNGSGKTTLLRVLTGQLEPDAGTVKAAGDLRIVWFEQSRNALDLNASLKDSLSPNSDIVEYRGEPIHVNGWAKRFGFDKDQLNTPLKFLSGGEQSRVLIAQLMLQPADVLILDEPTNDLDIPTLEVLEDTLMGFPGVLVLVTHDRFLLDSVSTQILALNGEGGAQFFSGVAQWETWTRERAKPKESASAKPKATAMPSSPAASSRNLSQAERRELEKIEGKIEQADAKAAEIETLLATPAVSSDAAKLREMWDALEEAKAEITRLYTRWEELETKQVG
ncbi:MAG: ABC-F family ATP-binding cassette domain-containing protein [Armatimonadetes bacterium]|nr:ABC-F family ATP-binding cassette domain-containing protein [Armatimonadota bacterium]